MLTYDLQCSISRKKIENESFLIFGTPKEPKIEKYVKY